MQIHAHKHMFVHTHTHTHYDVMSWLHALQHLCENGKRRPHKCLTSCSTSRSMPRHSRALVTFSEMFAQGSPSGNEPLFPRDHVTSPSKSPPSRDLHAQLHSRTAGPHQEHLIENHRIQFRFSHDPALGSSHLSRSLTLPHPEISRNKEDL